MKAKLRHSSTIQDRDPRSRTDLDLHLTSLMFPTEAQPPPAPVPTWEADLGLEELVRALARDRRYAVFVRQTLTALTTDPGVIAWRQAVLADFLRNPDLTSRIATLLPRLSELREGRVLLGQRDRNLLLETADRLAELDLYIEVIHNLHDSLTHAEIESSALLQLRDNLAQLLANENFKALRAELPTLRAPMANIGSLTIGVNLDADLHPVSAVLMAVNERQVGESLSLLERLLGSRTVETDETGVATLHHVPREPDVRQLSPLFQDLDRLLVQVAQPIARALNRYVRVGTRSLVNLEYELGFFIAAADLIGRLKARGMVFCQPEIVPMHERSSRIDHLCNINLALKHDQPPVSSHTRFDDEGRIGILTGPNSGGKTTYLRGVGLAQVMFQAGLFIPAQYARLSPVDVILTHFPALETRQQGRLAEEADRLLEIFRQATPHSLVLLNETFSSTASGEALYLAHDLLCALRAIGLRAIYATHLTELADRIDEIESLVEGDSRVFCLVAGIAVAEDGLARPTFQIQRGLPLGRSYAQEIAQQHGISLAQILEMYRSREHGVNGAQAKR